MNTSTVETFTPAKSTVTKQSLVIYHFFEKDESYIRNFAHFLLFGYRQDADFLIVIAGETSLDLPTRSNIQYLQTRNQNNDFGGYCEALRHLGDHAVQYEYVYFVNSSVRGPFVPSFAEANWLDVFHKRMTPDVGLVGTTINILPLTDFAYRYKSKFGGHEPFSHVQTMAYAMPAHTLRFLLDQNFYSADTVLTKEDVIENYELRLSQLVKSNGWNIACFLPEYGGIDFRKPHHNINPTAPTGDPNFSHTYFGRAAHPLETLFVKTNRGLFTEAYLDRLAYSLLCHAGSSMRWHDCKLVSDYVVRLEAGSRSTDPVSIVESNVTIDDVTRWTEAMLVQYPVTRSRVAQLLERYPVV
jgi:hypothetical protein